MQVLNALVGREQPKKNNDDDDLFKKAKRNKGVRGTKRLTAEEIQKAEREALEKETGEVQPEQWVKNAMSGEQRKKKAPISMIV